MIFTADVRHKCHHPSILARTCDKNKVGFLEVNFSESKNCLKTIGFHRFFENERNKNDSEDALVIGVERLLKLYFGRAEDRSIGIEHWHIPNEEVSELLWLRQSINEKILHVSGFPCALFLITGLREAIQGNNVYWTKRHYLELKDTKEWIESYVASRIPSGQMLNLLII